MDWPLVTPCWTPRSPRLSSTSRSRTGSSVSSRRSTSSFRARGWRQETLPGRGSLASHSSSSSQGTATDYRPSTRFTLGSGRTTRTACSKTGTRAEAARSKREGLTRTELTITRVAETGHDVALVVEALVESGDMDRNIGVRARKGAHPFWRRDDADVFDPLRAPLLQDVDRLGRRAAGREHRVEHEADLHGRRGRKLVVVGDRPERSLIAEETDVPDLRLGHELERPLHHADAGS